MTAVIEVEGLRKEHRSLRGQTRVALDGLDLSVPAGGVFGFLGPHGSGIWPGRARWLIGENAAILATAADLDGTSPCSWRRQ